MNSYFGQMDTLLRSSMGRFYIPLRSYLRSLLEIGEGTVNQPFFVKAPIAASRTWKRSLKYRWNASERFFVCQIQDYYLQGHHFVQMILIHVLISNTASSSYGDPLFFWLYQHRSKKIILTLLIEHSFLAITPAAIGPEVKLWEYVGCRHMCQSMRDHGFKGSELGKCTKIREFTETIFLGRIVNMLGRYIISQIDPIEESAEGHLHSNNEIYSIRKKYILCFC